MIFHQNPDLSIAMVTDEMILDASFHFLLPPKMLSALSMSDL